MSNFLGYGYNQVRVFNILSGALNFPAFDPDSEEVWEKLVRQLILIQEEVSETLQAIKNGDKVETLDGFCDMLFTVHGFGTILEQAGYNVDDAYEVVCLNNSTKFPKDIETVEKSLGIYGDSVDYRYDTDYQRYVITRKDSGKVMKPHGYERVNLEKFVPAEQEDYIVMKKE